MFSCEFCEIFKNTYFYRRPLVAASVTCLFLYKSSRRRCSIKKIFHKNVAKFLRTPFYRAPPGDGSLCILWEHQKNYQLTILLVWQRLDQIQQSFKANQTKSENLLWVALTAYFNKIESPEEPVRRCSSKKVFLKISQYSLGNTCVGVSF